MSRHLKNPTVTALIARGIDTSLAEKLMWAGETLATLQQSSEDHLTNYGLSEFQIAKLRKGKRPPIPKDNVIKVIWENRFLCCVCRDPDKAVILHHINSWMKTRDHSPENLALVCLDHHAQAHRTGSLEQNLTPAMLHDFKRRWEEKAHTLDSQSVLQMGRNPAFHWWWFNHVRILDMAKMLDIDVQRTAHFLGAKEHAQLEEDGSFGGASNSRSYLYQGGNGINLYRHMSQILHSVLNECSLFDISNDLDRSVLSRVVRQGDLILVRGRHHFSMIEKRNEGAGQTSEVYRQANNVKISFLIDRWEAVSNSSFSGWLRGTQNASSIVRVVDLEEHKDHLLIKATGIAIGGQMPGLETRSYFKPDCPINRYKDQYDADDLTAGFEDM